MPPDHLMVRVSGNADPDAYTAVGERCTARMLGAVAAFTQRPVVDVLDWGCGAGRMTVHLAARPELNVYGCDVDAEAVAWCRENINGDFAVSPLYPPLPYGDASFDAVLAMSVFTHLNRRLQRRWLRDLARVLRPGGVLVASVHGRAFASSLGAQDPAGVDDHYLNLGLTGIVPGGYYRDVIQTEAYTRSAWSDRFDVVAYREAALELHDLVVCRVRLRLNLNLRVYNLTVSKLKEVCARKARRSSVLSCGHYVLRGELIIRRGARWTCAPCDFTAAGIRLPSFYPSASTGTGRPPTRPSSSTAYRQ